jgi:hypothetical protein
MLMLYYFKKLIFYAKHFHTFPGLFLNFRETQHNVIIQHKFQLKFFSLLIFYSVSTSNSSTNNNNGNCNNNLNSSNGPITNSLSLMNGLQDHSCSNGGCDWICFNFGKELYTYAYRGVKKVSDWK